VAYVAAGLFNLTLFGLARLLAVGNEYLDLLHLLRRLSERLTGEADHQGHDDKHGRKPIEVSYKHWTDLLLNPRRALEPTLLSRDVSVSAESTEHCSVAVLADSGSILVALALIPCFSLC
jgi:hypothetical protein